MLCIEYIFSKYSLTITPVSLKFPSLLCPSLFISKFRKERLCMCTIPTFLSGINRKQWTISRQKRDCACIQILHFAMGFCKNVAQYLERNRDGICVEPLHYVNVSSKLLSLVRFESMLNYGRDRNFFTYWLNTPIMF